MKNFNARLKTLEKRTNDFIPDSVRREVAEIVEKIKEADRRERSRPDYNAPENVAKRKAEDEEIYNKLLAEAMGTFP